MTALWRREMVRFFRQRSRLVGALGSPLLFWLLLGSGVGTSFQLPPPGGNMSYMEYFFPGTAVLILLFTSIFSTISIIEDRKEGFLQGVLVAPIPRSAFVLGKLLGGTSLAVMQGLFLMLLAPLLGISVTAIPGTLATMALVAFGLTALGYLIAWRMDSTQGFHAIMNLFLVPMWLLSGSVFPASGAPAWLKWIITLNPLTYGLAAMRWSIYGIAGAAEMRLPSVELSFGVSLAFSAVMLALAIMMTRRTA
ncbi:MAG: ABC transporter permease [Acidobacteria bacterium]|nr:ABC transporter permease [Acidobacteriota bacterium]